MEHRHDIDTQSLKLSESTTLAKLAAPSESAVAHTFTNSYTQRDDQSPLREWIQIIFRYRWMIVAIVFCILPLVAIDTFRNRSIYEAVATIEVKKENSSLNKSGDFVVLGNPNNTKAEAYIIKRRPVLENTVVTYDLSHKNILQDKQKLTVWDAVKALFGQSAKPKSQSAASTESEAQTSPTPLGPPGKLTPEEKLAIAPIVGLLDEDVKVEPVRDTQLLRISFTHPNPELAALVANGVADNFIKYNFQMRIDKFSTTSDWLSESTRKLKAKMEEAEQKLANYSRTNNIFSIEGKENLTTDKLTNLHDQYMRAETDLLLKQSLYEEVKQGRVAQLPEAFADPKTADLQKQLNELKVEAAQYSSRLGPRHPRLVELRQQMETIQSQINDNRATLEEKLKADFERVQRDETSLKLAFENAKSAAVQQNQATIQFSILQQDLATAKSLYTDFLNKTSQVNIQRAEQYNNVSLIELAEPPAKPVGPNRLGRIIGGLVLSLVLGIGLAVLLEQLNTRIRNVEDITRLTHFPMLAVIPSLDKVLQNAEDKKLLAPGSSPDLSGTQLTGLEALMRTFNIGAESYRVLRTSVMLSTAGHPPKTILFTSGEPGDGKTTTIFNTAIALTQLNSSVIVIDCDMRKPRLHKVAQMDKGVGISTFLSSGAELNDCIRTTEIPNLSIMPCGPIPPNPSELISSNGMRSLLSELTERYDHVLIDSPPLATVTDPLILSTIVEGVVLITKSGKSSREVLRHVCMDLNGAGAKVLGIVLNNFNQKKEGSEYYSYRYDYEYAEVDHKA